MAMVVTTIVGTMISHQTSLVYGHDGLTEPDSESESCI